MGISPLIIGGALGAAGSVASSAIGASSASDAANAQVQAANTAAATQLQMYQTTRQDLMPWMQTGSAANSQLAALYGIGTGTGGTNTAPNTAAMTSALENTPGYQFTLDQGTQALDRSAASRGTLLSGGQLKDAQAYGQGLAQTNAWNPYITELNTLSTAGQNSAAGVGTLGAQYAGNIGSAQLAAGTASANGTLAGATALQGGIGSATNYLQSLYGSSYGGSGASVFNQPGADSSGFNATGYAPFYTPGT